MDEASCDISVKLEKLLSLAHQIESLTRPLNNYEDID